MRGAVGSLCSLGSFRLVAVLVIALGSATARGAVTRTAGYDLGLGRVVPSVDLAPAIEDSPPSRMWEPFPSWPTADSDVEIGARSFARRAGEDLVALVTSPVGWRGRNWRRLGLGILAIGSGSLVDEDIDRWVDSHRDSGAIRLATTMRPLGQEAGLALLGAAWIAGRHLDRPELTAVAQDGLEAALLAAGVVTPAIKVLAGRTRPNRTSDSTDFGGSGHSFPSGETTMAFAVASVIAGHSDRWWVDAAAYGTAGMIGVGRMRLDAHWASDVVAGALIGSAVGRWVVRRHRPEPDHRRSFAVVPTIAPDRYGVMVHLGF